LHQGKRRGKTNVASAGSATGRLRMTMHDLRIKVKGLRIKDDPS